MIMNMSDCIETWVYSSFALFEVHVVRFSLFKLYTLCVEILVQILIHSPNIFAKILNIGIIAQPYCLKYHILHSLKDPMAAKIIT